MPLVRIENYPQQIVPQHNSAAVYKPLDIVQWQEQLAENLVTRFLDAKLPGIGPRDHDRVHVTFGGHSMRASDKTMLIFVEGLFHHPERTKKVRDKLSRLLGNAAIDLLPRDWRVEVLVFRFDPVEDSHNTFVHDGRENPTLDP